MIRNYGEQYIRFDESVFQKIHPGLIQYRKRFLISVAIIIIAFFLVYPLLQLGWWGVLIFFTLFFIGVVHLLSVFLLQAYTVCIITNTRIIDIHRNGLFDKQVVELQLGHIQDIRYTTKGIVQSLLGYGTIIIQAIEGRGRIEMMNVKNPQEIQELLLRVQKQYIKKESVKQSTNNTLYQE